MLHLVLASTSKSRQSILSRLNIPFDICSPNVDENVLPQESTVNLAKRLSLDKAQSGAEQQLDKSIDDCWVIGGDQIAQIDDNLLCKPGTAEKAIEQLKLCSGKKVIFYSGICLFNVSTREYQLQCVNTHVFFRNLDEAEIQRYLKQEKSIECAGSFRSEGLGISLFKKIESDDPTALLGLPLISLCHMLRKAGFVIP